MEGSSFYSEVEDIMCDQRIISQELNVVAFEGNSSLSSTRFRVVLAIFTRTLIPTFVKFYAYLRNQQALVDNLRNELLPTILAFFANSISKSLASVQKGITYPLKLKTIREKIDSVEMEMEPEKSVNCTVLYTPKNEEITADVIFIHGLHGGVDKTWKQGRYGLDKLRSNLDNSQTEQPRNLKRSFTDIYWRRPKIARRDETDCATRMEGDWEVIEDVNVEDDYTNCWPQDWIPKDCPGARVIALNYTTDILWCPVWFKKRVRTDMVARSNEMIGELLRLGVGDKPIIWVGHSKGGLFIKQILVNCWENCQEHPALNNLFNQTKGIVFYSVPHKGSLLADIPVPLLRRSVELMEIKRNCNFVLDLHKRFLEICNETDFDADIFSFIETSLTFMTFVYLRIVAFESADPDIGVKYPVALDHREICKPNARDCFLYLELINLIKKYSNNANT